MMIYIAISVKFGQDEDLKLLLELLELVEELPDKNSSRTSKTC
jgi:hypothetical protein